MTEVIAAFLALVEGGAQIVKDYQAGKIAQGDALAKLSLDKLASHDSNVSAARAAEDREIKGE